MTGADIVNGQQHSANAVDMKDNAAVDVNVKGNRISVYEKRW